MTKAVFKYELPLHDEFTLRLIKGAEPISVMVQHNKVQMWALVDPDELRYESKYFRLAGTGHNITQTIKCHVGSFQLEGGSLVFHVFEVEP